MPYCALWAERVEIILESNDSLLMHRQRLPQKYVYYHKSPEHRNHYILSFAFAFDREEDVYQFSFSYPYSYSRCQAHLTLVEQKELPYVKRESLASSLVLDYISHCSQFECQFDCYSFMFWPAKSEGGGFDSNKHSCRHNGGKEAQACGHHGQKPSWRISNFLCDSR